MKLTAGILRKIMEIAELLGCIYSAHLYDNNFISVDGRTRDRKKFSITMRIEEEEKDDQELE